MPNHKGFQKRITLEERKKIEELLHCGTPKSQIARELGLHKTTVYREMNRCKESYVAEEAHATHNKSKNLIDFEIIGKRFGLLVVEGFANIYKKRSWWHCNCDCGKKCIISRKILAEYCSPKRQLSCGCVPKQWKNKIERLPIEELSLRKFHDLLKFRKIEGECWEWTGGLTKGKTPRCSWQSKVYPVRKLMYMLINGITNEKNRVHTTCGNLMCFNPEHLTLDTPSKRHFYKNG